MAKKAVTAVKIKPQKLTKLDLGVALFNLAELGVKTIEITYSGGGDSGSLEEFNPRDKKDALIDESELDRWSEIQTMLEEWAYKRLQDTEGDWINNEGGSGTFTIQVPSGDYKLDHSINVQEDYDYSGKISEEME